MGTPAAQWVIDLTKRSEMIHFLLIISVLLLHSNVNANNYQLPAWQVSKNGAQINLIGEHHALPLKGQNYGENGYRTLSDAAIVILEGDIGTKNFNEIYQYKDKISFTDRYPQSYITHIFNIFGLNDDSEYHRNELISSIKDHSRTYAK